MIDPLTAYQITSIMEGVIQRGTGIAIKEVGKHLAGKTGTTNEAKDLWFVGYSPNLAFGVFMGYDKPRSLGDSAQAALYTAPIFRDFMKMALEGHARHALPRAARHQADLGRRAHRHALERPRLDHGGLQARHFAARRLFRRQSDRPQQLLARRREGGRDGTRRALLSSVQKAAVGRGARLHRGLPQTRLRSPIENSLPMRAEAEQLVETIKQSMGLLRRHL